MNTDYVFDTSEEPRELVRLHMLERIFDAGTQRRLLATGLTSGWHCLEVGAGAGSIVRWLEQRVGPSGKVVALDTNPRFLRGSGARPLKSFKATFAMRIFRSRPSIWCMRAT